jgi:hypothetical protein
LIKLGQAEQVDKASAGWLHSRLAFGGLKGHRGQKAAAS